MTGVPSISAQEEDTDTVYDLSPFVVEEDENMGYYASQTLSGGRLRQELKNTGSSIQVITPEYLEDIGATGVEELLQYTTSTEVAGILAGTSADVEVILDRREDTLRIPSSGVAEGGKVLVVEDGILVEAVVEVGLENWQVAEVLSGSLRIADCGVTAKQPRRRARERTSRKRLETV